MEVSEKLKDEILGLFIFLDEPEGLPYLYKTNMNKLYGKGYSEKEIVAATTYLLAERYIYESSVIGDLKQNMGSFYYHLTNKGIKIRLEGGFEKLKNDIIKANSENEMKTAIAELQRKQLKQQTDNFIAPKYTLLISIIAILLSVLTIYMNYSKSRKDTEIDSLNQKLDSLETRIKKSEPIYYSKSPNSDSIAPLSKIK